MYVIPLNEGRKAKNQLRSLWNSEFSIIFFAEEFSLKSAKILLTNVRGGRTHMDTK